MCVCVYIVKFYSAIRRTKRMPFVAIWVDPQFWIFPGDSVSKESACNVGDPGSIPGLGKSPVEGNSNPIQYSCLKNFTDRGAWWTTVYGVTKSQTQMSN